jgi:hypothetical protein
MNCIQDKCIFFSLHNGRRVGANEIFIVVYMIQIFLFCFVCMYVFVLFYALAS